MQTHNLQLVSELSPHCSDNLEAGVCRGGGIVVSPIRQIVSAVRRQFGGDVANLGIVQTLSAQCARAAFSLAPGFSQVSGAIGIGQPFQRFLSVGGKPLKRFSSCTATNTRLKPGANEITDSSGIHVASYVTKLIPKKRLEQKLHEAVKMARARLAEGGKL